MDLSQYQFNLERSPLDVKDYMMESIYPEEVTLPEVWDLRPQMQPVRDQGSQGTCSAQTASAMKEWQERIDVQFNNYMSPQFVYNLRENASSSGMYPRNTMDILYKIGIVSESEYPYNTFKPITEELKISASQYKIQGYAQINTLDSAKKSLFLNGPIYFAFPVYNPNNMAFWKQEYNTQPILGGHAVNCCGYLKDCFIIRNSWSMGWGDGGYTYYPFSEFGMHWEIWSAVDLRTTMTDLVTKSEEYVQKKKKKRKKRSKKDK